VTGPGRPTLEEIRRAAKIVSAVTLHTPLVPFRDECLEPVEPPLLLKPEILQPVTSFKLRGVFWAVASMSEEERGRGVSTVSAGNTAQALAWAARHFGVQARSLMPETAPTPKIDAVRALGAEPVLVSVDELFAYLKEHRWEQEPWSFVHPWTDRRVLVGHGSLGLEIAQDCPEVESVYLSVGGGGLLAGTASALRQLCPGVRIVAVEPTGCAALAAALDRDRPVEVPCSTLCDGVAVPYITEEMFPLLRELVDDVVLVDDEDTRRVMSTLLLRHKMLVEPAGAITVAAARRDHAGRAVAVLSGGSVGPDLLASLLAENDRA
jgi:threonine dehydratase